MITDLKKTKASRVCGIDCSTYSLAFCIFYNKKPVKWGKILFEGATVFERLVDASKKVRALLDQFDVDFIAMERAVLGASKNVKVTIDLSLVYGAVLAQLLTKNVKTVDINPLEWQRAIGNPAFTPTETKALKLKHPGKSSSWYTNKKREVRKQRTLDFVNGRWHLGVTDDDIGDAVSIAYVAYSSMTRRK